MSDVSDQLDALIKNKDFDEWKLRIILDNFNANYSSGITNEILWPVLEICSHLKKQSKEILFQNYMNIVKKHEHIKKYWEFKAIQTNSKSLTSILKMNKYLYDPEYYKKYKN